MSVYITPALNAVDFPLASFTPADNTPPYNVLAVYTTPALNAVDFALTVYTVPTYPYVGWELLPGGGTDYNESVTETLTLSDSQSAVADFVSAITEVLATADSQSAAADFLSSLGEALALADSQSAAAGFLADLTDALALAASQDATAQFADSVTDTLNLIETLDDVHVRRGIGGQPVWKPPTRRKDEDYLTAERRRYRNVQMVEDAIAAIYYYK